MCHEHHAACTSLDGIGGSSPGSQTAHSVASVGRTGWGSIGSGLTRVIVWAARARDLRRAERALAGMGEHMLRDIGLGPSEIEHAIRHGRFSIS